MTRFVHLKNNCNDMLINTRAIVGVSNLDEEIVTVELFDGTTHRVDRSHLPEITGDEAITQIIPCHGVYALYGKNIDVRETVKIDYMALTASGQMRPLDSFFNFVDVMNHNDYEFMGFGVERPRAARK